MSMESSRRNFYFWILITTLAHWVVECDKLEGYSFPVYNTTSCPRNLSGWRSRSSDLNCTESNGYMCIPNENITQLLEFCYRYPRIPIEKNICLILKKSTSLVEAYSCKLFRSGCPDKQYWSNEIFKYPSCLSIGHRCFLDEPLCKDEGIATIGPSETKVTQGTTNVYLGSTILNTSLGNTPLPDIDGSTTWVWILVIGIFLLIVFILVFALLIIFRRGNQKTLGDGHEEEETIPLKMGISGEREIFIKEEIPLIVYKNEIKKSKRNQGLDEEALLLPANTKTSDKENTFGDRYTLENQGEILCLDKTSRTLDSSKDDISKEENSSLDKDVSDKINSHLKQLEDSYGDVLERLNKDKINRKKIEEGGGDKKSNDESLKTDIAGKHDNILHLDETSEMTAPSSENYREKEYVSLGKEVPKWNSRNTQNLYFAYFPLFQDTLERGKSVLQQEKDSDRITSEELRRANIYFSGYEVWKTEISGKYRQLSAEERAALFLLLCSNENTFILENTKTFRTRPYFCRSTKTEGFSTPKKKNLILHI